MLTEKDFKDTLLMMDACNGPALLVDLAKIVPRIWEEARFYNKGTDWVCRHPIMLLWISKITSLQYGKDAPYRMWTMAYNYCKAKANGLEVGKDIEIWLPENQYGELRW
jgi:hypothetical protein